jgi:hypothetical protein
MQQVHLSKQREEKKPITQSKNNLTKLSSEALARGYVNGLSVLAFLSFLFLEKQPLKFAHVRGTLFYKQMFCQEAARLWSRKRERMVLKNADKISIYLEEFQANIYRL